MSGFSQINLGKLPAPSVVKTVDYEVLLAEMKARVIELLPEMAMALELESEPVVKILQACAYFRALDRIEFNDGAHACMLALSTDSNLDGLGALWGVERLVVQEADDTPVPPVPEILESDEAFRARIQLSLEGHTTAGPSGAYVYWALTASGEVKDASVNSPAPGEVLVTVLSHDADGTPSAALLSAVETQLNDEDVRPLTDLISIQAAQILPYTIDATLDLYHGPASEAVIAAAQAAIEAFVQDHHRLGHDITISGIHAALHQQGVQNVTLVSPAADIQVASSEAAYCTGTSVILGVRDV